MPNDRNYENYAVASGESLYAVLLKEANTTSRNIVCYTGYYMGGTPVILDPKPFDLARDLSTGNLWQYTGSAWVAPSWQTSITLWLGGATTVCERLKAPDTKIPSTIEVYYGTDDNVPPELALNADDLAIKHDVGNYNLEVNVMRRDVTTNTMVDVPFPEGYIATTDDGDWTVLKNFTQCVGYDYAMVSLAWTTTADGTGPQSVDYVTSSGAEIIASAVVSGALVNYPTSSAVEEMISSGGGMVSGALISGAEINTSVGVASLVLTASHFSAGVQDSASIYVGVAGVYLSGSVETAPIELNAYVVSAIADQSLMLATSDSGTVTIHGGDINLGGNVIRANGAGVATEPWVQQQIAYAGYLNTESGRRIATDTTVDIVKSGGTGYCMPVIDVWYESGYIDYIEDYPQAYIGSKNISLTSSGGNYVHVFDNEVWASAGDDVVRILQGSMFSETSAGVIVISADMEVLSNSISDIHQAPIASSVDGGLSWQLIPGETLPWFASNYDTMASGNGSCVSCGGEFVQSGAVVSGALLSNTEIDTTVGGYHLTYTAAGGLTISGGGVQLRVSSGGIVVSADDGNDGANVGTVLSMTSGGGVNIHAYDYIADGREMSAWITPTELVASGASGESVVLSGGAAKLYATDGGNEASVSVTPGYASISGDHIRDDFRLTVNGSPVLTELATETDSETTVVSFAVLSGGTSYIYTQPLTALIIDSITSDCRAEFDFTAASGAQIELPPGARIKLLGLSSLEAGKHYLVVVNGARVEVNSYTIVGE